MLEKFFFSGDYVGAKIEAPMNKFSAVQGAILDALKSHTGREGATTTLLLQ